MCRSSLLCLALFLTLSPSAPGQAVVEADLLFLKNQKIDTSPEELVNFFRRRTLRTDDREAVASLIRKLGSASFSERALAAKELEQRGPAVLPILRAALKDAEFEVVRRGETLIKSLEAGLNPDLLVAAARVLAQRRPPGGIDALLDFLPHAEDPWLEEELLGSLGKLAVRRGEVEPALVAALESTSTPRRAAAAYALAQRGAFDQRDLLRRLLADAAVRERVALGLVGKRIPQVYRDSFGADETLIKASKLGIDEPALLAFLRSRTLSDDDQARLRQWVRDLGHPTFKVRSDASRNLVKQNAPALPFLARAVEDGDIEVSRRARICMEEIQRGPGPALPLAVIRVLARPAPDANHAPAAAIRVLLDYVPYADDENVEEEAINALCVLSVREEKIDPLLPAALRDALPARRGVAAMVLGKVGLKEHQAPIRQLLVDSESQVRGRAALGLLAAHDPASVPALVEQIKDGPARSLWKIEEQLFRLAADQGPAATMEDRAKAHAAWAKWWQSAASHVDLGTVSDGAFHLGLITVCEYDSAVGKPGGQVWEAARDGKPRWKIPGLLGVMDAHVLPNGRVLVAENSAQRVTERDLAGAIVWEFRLAGNPIACQRLPNGNTFIATYNQILEVTPDKKTVWSHNRGANFFIFSAQRLRNGHILCMTAQGQVHEIDPQTGKEARTMNLGLPQGGWCGVDALPNGRYLVASMNTNQVWEVDAAGKQHWKANYPGVFRATRLPNGHTLVASMTTRKIAELDRGGSIVWEKTCEGRPWSVRYR